LLCANKYFLLTDTEGRDFATAVYDKFGFMSVCTLEIWRGSQRPKLWSFDAIDLYHVADQTKLFGTGYFRSRLRCIRKGRIEILSVLSHFKLRQKFG